MGATVERAHRVLPGGVDSPVRAFGAVGGDPIVAVRGEGPWIFDEEGRRYADFVGSWGPLILGHRPPEVLEAVRRALEKGWTYGLTCPGEVELAELVVAHHPAAEKVRFVCSGTEATMSALRLARAATGREFVVKFAGGYHGHADAFLAEAGSGVETLSIPGTPGVPAVFVERTLVLPYNDAPAVRELLRRRGDEVACVFVEPVAGNMGVVPPEPGFLETLREATEACGALLVFDEVITGFRLAPGGAAERFGVVPDLVCFGKVIGGGFPVGAFAGPAEIMDRLAPQGPVYQAGTLAGNPVAMAAGAETLRQVTAPGFHERLERRAESFFDEVERIARASGGVRLQRVGSMATLFFREGPVRDLSDARQQDTARFARFHRALRERGVLLPPSPFEAWFVSAAHDDEALGRLLDALPEALKA